METLAVIIERPEQLALSRVGLTRPEPGDVVVDVDWSGISTGTERLLWSGRMPTFPGMGYPLVPGYESVGTIVEAGPASGRKSGERVFVPGSRGFTDVRGLFGGAARRLIVPGSRVAPIQTEMGDQAVLLALAATAYHATSAPGARQPDLIVGHGVLGRLLARLAIAAGAPPPVVWESDPGRRGGGDSYSVVDPSTDQRRDYGTIYDVSGDGSLLDTLIQRLSPGGEIVLAGFYEKPLSFAFPPAFMREVRLRVAAEWRPADLQTVLGLVAAGRLSLDGLITHRCEAIQAEGAYRTAFTNRSCLKMVLDWRHTS